jgi:hypothetical protein
LAARIERLQARDESIGVAAPVRMMRPDEIPAAALNLVNLVLFHRRPGGELAATSR